MTGHAEQCVERYLELTGEAISSLKTVSTPCIDDHLLLQKDFQDQGEVAEVASRIVRKAFYLTRTERPDILDEVMVENVTCRSQIFRKFNAESLNLKLGAWKRNRIQSNDYSIS